ncbi:MAG: DAK2 domain-containing protein, partial [Chloroflexota bacterium]|nr:DAK2 domain-containing protein [Chloroflexota bacterium]
MAIIRTLESQLITELAVVNGLNVFPVPDGDTGTNMLATIREAIRQAECAATLKEASRLLAFGAMLGARGNSGVILSQFFRAFHEVLSDSSDIGAAELGRILILASDLAYQTVTHPAEGTMLSVMSATARTASLKSGEDEEGFLVAILEAATESVARTPEQLPILREAQVVDAGGYGFALLLRGCYEALVGRPAPPIGQELLGLSRIRELVAHGGAHPADLVPLPSQGYGCCVTVLVEAPGADDGPVRRRLEELGDSVLVVAAGGKLKLHAHVRDPQLLLDYARELGAIQSAEVSNIDEQTSAQRSSVCAVVAVAPGEGLAKLFRNLGAAATVIGGPRQNPSTAELLDAMSGLGEAEILLLPNNANVLAAARQAANMRSNVHLIPS